MDPQVCLESFLEALDDYHAFGQTRPDDVHAQQIARDEAMELADALANWIARGGFLPRNPCSALASQHRQLLRKVAHGCADAVCSECDEVQS